MDRLTYDPADTVVTCQHCGNKFPAPGTRRQAMNPVERHENEMRQEFDKWMKKVEGYVVELTGLSTDDLPDCCYYDWYEDGMAPKPAARKAMRQAGY